MFWLRWIVFSAPLWLGFGGAWLFARVADFQLMRESDAIVHAIREPVGYLAPFGPVDPVSDEIAGLLFEPLLRRDERLRLQPNLLTRWSARTAITIRCESEEAAGETEARIRAGEAPGKGPRPVAIERTGAVIFVVYDSAAPELEETLLAALPEGLLGEHLLIRVRARHSAGGLVESWLEGSIEKAAVAMIEAVDAGEVRLFISGDPERLMKELRLFLEANPATDPRLEIVGKQSHSSERELLLDFREGVRWHDGAPFTARDIAFSWNEAMRPDAPLPLAKAFDYIESLEVAGPHRLRLRCRSIPGTMLESWERLPVLAEHLWRGPLDEATRESLLQNPVGLGPYRLDRRRKDGGVELVANEDSYRGVPREKRLRWRQFASLESTLDALRAKGLDLLEPDERFLEWTARNPGMMETWRDRPRFQQVVLWNLDREPFKRIPVRQALARAVDLAAILRDTATGFETPVTGLFPPGLPFVAEPMLLPLHDPRGAERLLEEEGFPLDGESGWHVDATGKPLGFTLVVAAENVEHLRLAHALAEQWAAVGVEVRVEAVAWAALVPRLGRREYDAVLVSWELPTSRDLRELWHSSAAGAGGGNLTGLSDPGVDRLVESLRDETDPARLPALVSDLQKAIAAAQPCLFVCNSGRILNLRKDALLLGQPGAEPIPVPVEAGGLEATRPWWVRSVTLTNASP